ncbi:MAG: LLM class flavin-dependent oxidoreductase, partial [Candidatus Tectomicrobia bacterium]|nr:LLM class flavin-dependent oxidoreductase [Candidatus Tectomicrobia bacterium]
HIAQVCERGKLDMVFFADFNYIFDTYQNAPDTALRYAAQTPMHDPIPLLSWMAAVTSRIGLASTLSLSHQHPHYISRLFATLDHLTCGRVGWNVVTFSNAHETSVDHNTELEHDQRYERADEFLEVCYKLWASWEEEALLMDRDSGIFADTGKIHCIDHSGTFFRSRGPLNVTPSPQGRPVIIQAGASDRGRDFAAKHAEVIFAIQPFVEGAAAYYADVKTRMAAHGRHPDACKILFGVQPFIAETEQAAQDKQTLHNSLVPLEGAVAHLSGASGHDFSPHPLNKIVESFPSPRSQGVVDMYTKVAGKRLTLREMALMHGQSVGFPQIVGTPAQVADQLEAYFDQAGGDGFMLTMPYTPGSIEEFVAWVIPELQKRGRFRTDYQGNTLRELLHQGG